MTVYAKRVFGYIKDRIMSYCRWSSNNWDCDLLLNLSWRDIIRAWTLRNVLVFGGILSVGGGK